VRVAAVILLLIAGTAAGAEGAWSNQYLANMGGSKLTVVDASKRQSTQASVSNSDGVVLYVECSLQEFNRARIPFGFLGFSRVGEPFIGRDAQILASFDGGTEIDLGPFSYAGGRYSGGLAPQVVAMLMSRQTVAIRDTKGDFAAQFTLNGAGPAIRNVECFG
jgi:hypothetical protein